MTDNHWRLTTLGEFAPFSYGSALKADSRDGGEHLVFGSNGIIGSHSKTLIDDQMVVIGRKGSVGEVTWAPKGGWPIDTTFYVKGSTSERDIRFTYYLLKTLGLSNMNSDSAVPGLNRNNAHALSIRVPPLQVQKEISGFLGTFDHLIQINSSLIDQLLELVNAIFFERFGLIDVSLELGEIASIVDCLHSKKPERVSSGGTLLQLNNIRDNGLLDLSDMYFISEEDYSKWAGRLRTSEWDCLITNVGRVGAVARIPKGVHAALGRNMTGIRPRNPQVDGPFIIAALLSSMVRKDILNRVDSGTILDALNVKNIPKIRLPQVKEKDRKQFSDFVRPMLELSDSLSAENIELSRQRDELQSLLFEGRAVLIDSETAS